MKPVPVRAHNDRFRAARSQGNRLGRWNADSNIAERHGARIDGEACDSDGGA